MTQKKCENKNEKNETMRNNVDDEIDGVKSNVLLVVNWNVPNDEMIDILRSTIFIVFVRLLTLANENEKKIHKRKRKKIRTKQEQMNWIKDSIATKQKFVVISLPFSMFCFCFFFFLFHSWTDIFFFTLIEKKRKQISSIYSCRREITWIGTFSSISILP